MSIFSLLYSAYEQRMVEEALSADDLETAVKWLEKMPVALQDADKVGRAVVLSEGYRSVAEMYGLREVGELKSYREIIREGLGCAEGDEVGVLEEALDRLNDYEGLGDVNKFKEVSKQIEKYKTLVREELECEEGGELEELEKVLGEFKDYKAIGVVEELTKLSDELKEYQELGSVEALRKLVDEERELNSVLARL